MNVLIIGAGMYVTGRDNSGTGTILSSLAEISKSHPFEQITVIAKNPDNKKHIQEAQDRINKKIDSSIFINFESVNIEDQETYLEYINKRKFDCAIVSIPDDLHFKATKPLLENKIHTLVVKPFTPTLKEAEKLTDIQKKNKVYGAVEFHKRFDETNLSVKKHIEDGTLGKILYFSVDYSQRREIPLKMFKSWAERTNIFQYLGVHYVDLIYFLTNFIPSKVMAIGTNGLLKDSSINSYDSVHASILWNNPDNNKDFFYSHFNISWIDPNNTSALSDQKYKVVGTKGRMECDQKNRGLELVHEDLGIQQINPYFSDYLYDPNGKFEFSGYGHKSISLFIKDVSNIQNNSQLISELETTRPSFKQSLISTAVIDAANASLEAKGEWKRINDKTK